MAKFGLVSGAATIPAQALAKYTVTGGVVKGTVAWFFQPITSHANAI
jgi:hypothetical protein